MIRHCESAGVRLDVFLTQALEGITRSAAQRLLEGNHVKKDGQPVKKNQKTEAGADYTVEIPNAQPIALQPEKIDLEIAYEDSDVVIIKKPKGMVVHPRPGIGRGRWSMHGCSSVANLSQESTANCALASCTGSIRTPPACCW